MWGAMIAFILLLVSSLGERPIKPAVVLRQIDAESFVLTSRQTIDEVRVQDAWQFADWDVDHDPQHRRTWLKITTKKRPLRIAVETTLPKTQGLTRTHWVEVR